MLFIRIKTLNFKPMIPGLDYIYQCPECGKRISIGSILSGNTFGATIYSDGKKDAPMLPNYPDLVKCSKCEAFFWLHNLRPVEEIDAWQKKSWEETNNEEYPLEASFLDLPDLLVALDKKVYRTEIEELDLRQNIWWAFNDRVRAGKEIFARPDHSAIWEDNLRKFQAMLDPEDPSDSVRIAEIHRNLSEFDKCMKKLNTIKDPDVIWVVEKIKSECMRGNSLVVKLS